jgi:NDP-sugar pyrophosphorylase family protein
MINIVVPMAGRGARFVVTGELTPKPLIEVPAGKPMIEHVIRFLSLQESHRLIFVCRAEHETVHGIGSRLRALAEACEIVYAERLTGGPSDTALLAAPFVNNDDELLVAYCDSFLTIDVNDFIASCRGRNADGGIIVYPSSNPSDSYAAIDGEQNVLRTAEKQVISVYGTAGFYYFRKGADFVTGARALADKSRPGTELFVCPVYNELIRRGRRVVSYAIENTQQIEMGTPDDLVISLRWFADRVSAHPARAIAERAVGC